MTATLTYGISGTGISALADTVSVTVADAVDQYDVTIPALSVDFNVAVSMDVSELKFVYITADAAMTIETNDGASPVHTLTLVADEPYVWTHKANLVNKFVTTDVTSFKVTSTAGGTLKVRVGYDSTP
jgi:hypothetical protein